MSRLKREIHTLEVMIKIFCRAKHHKLKNEPLCLECLELFKYAKQKSAYCRFGENKPVCAKCPVHCYQKKQKEQIKKVMVFSGPKMLIWHPYLLIRHAMDRLA